MDEWIDMLQPKSYAALQVRPDAVLFRLAFLTEVSAFEKLKVMSFHLTAAHKPRHSSGQAWHIWAPQDDHLLGNSFP
eukprot:COSAG01_NODE_851_length_13121_cov_49.974044_12_plen_77_part_00